MKPMARPIRVRIHGENELPRRPGAKDLTHLFQQAWRATPVARRPVVPARQALLVQLMWVDDREIADLHARFFGKRETTDVVSFPMLEYDLEQKAFLLGEIAVSCETGRREAARRHLPLEQELSRYALHGFLHLIGYCDKTVRERRDMTAHQERILETQLKIR